MSMLAQGALEPRHVGRAGEVNEQGARADRRLVFSTEARESFDGQHLALLRELARRELAGMLFHACEGARRIGR